MRLKCWLWVPWSLPEQLLQAHHGTHDKSHSPTHTHTHTSVGDSHGRHVHAQLEGSIPGERLTDSRLHVDAAPHLCHLLRTSACSCSLNRHSRLHCKSHFSSSCVQSAPAPQNWNMCAIKRNTFCVSVSTMTSFNQRTMTDRRIVMNGLLLG